MKLFNGDYGCQFCKEKGENIERVHVYPYNNNLQLRTSDESIEYGKQAFDKSDAVFGVKGPTELSKFVYKYIETTSIDIMHCAYVGLTIYLCHWTCK